MAIVGGPGRGRLVESGDGALLGPGLALARVGANVGGEEQDGERRDFRNEVEEEEVHRAMDEGWGGEQRGIEVRSDEVHVSVGRSAAVHHAQKRYSKSNSMKSKRNRISFTARKKKVKEEISRMMIICGPAGRARLP